MDNKIHILYNENKMKRKQLRVAADIDNVSTPMAEHVLNAINSKYGSNFTIEDITEWYQKLKHGDKNINYTKELFNNYDTPGFLSSASVMPGAKEGIKTLLDRGHEVNFLTGRHSKYMPETKEWAKQIDPDLNVVHAPEGKQHHIKNFDILLDDSPKELYNVGIHGGNPVTYDRPWNRNVKNLSARRVADWKQFTDSVD